MEAFNINSKKILGPDIRILFVPVVLLVGIFFLFTFSFKFILPRITTQTQKIKEVRGRMVLLEEKIEILREIRERLLYDTDVSLVAVPDTNPGLWKFSQIKGYAEENQVNIENSKVGGEIIDKRQITKVRYTVKVNGSLEDIFAYLNDLINSSPMVNFSSAKLTTSRGEVYVTFDMETYHWELPTKIPAITEPVKRLSNDEENVLSYLSKLKKPEFTVLEPSGPYDRKDPFN